MPSLKEIKGRIASVKSTQKITSAMKMVSSAKLRKAQYQIEEFLPYQSRLTNILNNFLSGYSEDGFSSGLSDVREIQRIAIVVLSSNSSLCGAFNSNIIRNLQEWIKKYRNMKCEISVYPVGKKVEEAVRKLTIPVEIKGSYIPLMDKPNFEGAKEIADQLMNDFLAKKVDKVDLLYNHFKSTAVQVPTDETYLPIDFSAKQQEAKTIPTDYIIEPDRKTLLNSLIPRSLRSKIYAILLDSAAAEQAARTVAMQIATDNADEILDELTIQYNKQRQQSITSELLDIIGGSEALK
jgi:F-type H+-transporting ATPase subunit gamma